LFEVFIVWYHVVMDVIFDCVTSAYSTLRQDGTVWWRARGTLVWVMRSCSEVCQSGTLWWRVHVVWYEAL